MAIPIRGLSYAGNKSNMLDKIAERLKKTRENTNSIPRNYDKSAELFINRDLLNSPYSRGRVYRDAFNGLDMDYYRPKAEIELPEVDIKSGPDFEDYDDMLRYRR